MDSFYDYFETYQKYSSDRILLRIIFWYSRLHEEIQRDSRGSCRPEQPEESEIAA